MPNSSLATVEEDGCVILSRVQALSPVGTREVTVVPAAKNQTKPNQTNPALAQGRVTVANGHSDERKRFSKKTCKNISFKKTGANASARPWSLHEGTKLIVTLPRPATRARTVP